MKIRLAAVCVILLSLFVLNGCAKKSLPDLPNDAAAFEFGSFEDVEHDHALFGTIEYNGRTYIAYGTTNRLFKPGCVESCVGYIIQDEHSASVADPNNTDRRVYTVTGDSEQNFLIEYDDTVKLMNQPTFYRATDTKGKAINVPDYIDSLSYEFWGE